MAEDRNSLAWWFPRLPTDGSVRVPKTVIMEMSDAAARDVISIMDLRPTTPEPRALNDFCDGIPVLAVEAGIKAPFFLRTAHTSGKHDWKRTCFVADADNIRAHVWALIEHSEMAGIVGLPWTTFVVRELLPTETFGVCPRYGDMPVAKEVRFFVDDGEIRCWHPYWPREALKAGGSDIGFAAYIKLCFEPASEWPEMVRSVRAAGRALGGSWSVDMLRARDGWYLIDMALAKNSFHWEGCPHA